jgi:hypothetical protein
MIDFDLAELYGVITSRLNEQVTRNRKRFPVDFMWRSSKVLVLRFLCATSVLSVSLWCIFALNSSTTETQRTERLHREEKYLDF